MEMESSMKSMMLFIVISALFLTLGCNYDYGKYGKDKKDTNTEQKSEEGTAANWQGKLEGDYVAII